MSEEQSAEKQAAEKAATEKAAAEEGEGRLRAFSVGIGQLCEDAKAFSYEKLAQESGVKPEALAPALVNAMIQAEDEQPAEQKA